MNNSIIQIIVLAGVAIFLILKLRSVLGTRDGFEQPPANVPPLPSDGTARRTFETIEAGPDRDIIDHVPDGSPAAEALTAIKRVEPGFSVAQFLQGARGAHEMILQNFAKGDIDSIRPYLAPDVAESFDEVTRDRAERGLKVTSEIIGLRELGLENATFDRARQEAELTVRFVVELTSSTRNAQGEVVEGDPKTARKQKDIWTFARKIGSNDPNWQLVATGA